jgi:hypothetical protein
MLVISWSVCAWQAFQPSLMFANMTRAYPSEAPLRLLYFMLNVATLNAVNLSDIMLSVVMLNAIMLSVVVPMIGQSSFLLF